MVKKKTTARNRADELAPVPGPVDPADPVDPVDSFTELLVDSFEAGVRGSVTLVKIPLVMCSTMTSSWAKALQSVLDEISKPGPDKP